MFTAIIIPEDVAIIRSILLGSTYRTDFLGWQFTKSGKYTVKSCYQTERGFSQLCSDLRVHGPDVRLLQAHVWKLKCPLKLRHFLWQVLSGCISVTLNLRKRWINCDTQCARCWAKETSNHVLFEWPPALQTWALSQVLSARGVFPMTSILSNIDYLFWRLPNQRSEFPWIIWYIWKARSDKIFKNLDRDPREILQSADTETNLWLST